MFVPKVKEKLLTPAGQKMFLYYLEMLGILPLTRSLQSTNYQNPGGVVWALRMQEIHSSGEQIVCLIYDFLLVWGQLILLTALCKKRIFTVSPLILYIFLHYTSQHL